MAGLIRFAGAAVLLLAIVIAAELATDFRTGRYAMCMGGSAAGGGPECRIARS